MILNIVSGELNGPKSIFLKKDKVWTSKSSLFVKFLKKYNRGEFVVVQLLSCAWLFETPWTAAHQASCSPSLGACSNSHPLSRWCHPTILSSVVPFSSCLQSFPTSGSFLKKSALHIRWPNYQSFSFSISPSNEYSGLMSFRIDWFDFLAIWGTLKSLLQHDMNWGEYSRGLSVSENFQPLTFPKIAITTPIPT